MFPALSRPARRTAAMIACLAAISVVAQFLHLNAIHQEPYPDTALSMARYFTILTSVLVIVTFAVAATRRQGVSSPWLAALTVAMVMVGAVYHTLLSGLVTFTGLGVWADHGLHTVLPLACLAWWLVFAPKRELEFVDLPIFVLWPSIYTAYALWRGAVDGIYPYPFMDLNTSAPAAVATNLAILMVCVLLAGVMAVSIGRFADR